MLSLLSDNNRSADFADLRRFFNQYYLLQMSLKLGNHSLLTIPNPLFIILYAAVSRAAAASQTFTAQFGRHGQINAMLLHF